MNRTRMAGIKQHTKPKIEVHFLWEPENLTWGPSFRGDGGFDVWFSLERATTFARELLDCVQAMDEAEREREP